MFFFEFIMVNFYLLFFDVGSYDYQMFIDNKTFDYK
jgi:hypothetical protein